eukprot:6173775-Pleurochrysis_carterae.AAC.2
MKTDCARLYGISRPSVAMPLSSAIAGDKKSKLRFGATDTHACVRKRVRVHIGVSARVRVCVRVCVRVHRDEGTGQACEAAAHAQSRM